MLKGIIWPALAFVVSCSVGYADDDTLRDLGATAAPGEVAKFDGSVWRAGHDDITQVEAGSGLIGGGSNVTISLAVDFGDSGVSNQAARVDHDHADLVPVGVVQAWLKSYPNVPALPEQWVECNGQVLNDTNSPFNGQTIPDLNGVASGTNRFLRGSATSGSVGGEDVHTLTVSEMPSHNHNMRDMRGSTGSGRVVFTEDGSNGQMQYTSSNGGDQPHENRPPYYEVVWIMRVK